MRLSEQEVAFCCYFAESGDVRGAAMAAGFSAGDAFLAGCGVLRASGAGRLIKRQRTLLFGKGSENEDVKMALRRLIFCGSGSLTTTEETAQVSGFDLFGAVELKQGKGALEVKLVNKLAAIEQLYTLETAACTKERSTGFFEALNSTKADVTTTEGGDSDGL